MYYNPCVSEGEQLFSDIAVFRRPEMSSDQSTSLEMDAFIIHGKNWQEYPPGTLKKFVRRLKQKLSRKKDEDFQLQLSQDSKITALVAGIVWDWHAAHQEKPPFLIFSTGKTAGKDWLSEAEEMVKYMRAQFPHIPDDYIVLEDTSYDTPGNIINSKKIITDRGLHNVGYLTIGYHIPRVTLLMDYYNVPIQVIYPSEQILRRRSAEDDRFVERYTHSREWRRQQRKESILIAETIFDPGQRFLSRFITPIVRHQ